MAQSQIRAQKAQVFVVEETSQDTFETPAAGDVFLAQEIVYGFNPEVTDQVVHLDGGLMPDPIPGRIEASLTFKCPLAGSGDTAPTTAPGFAEALKACGLAEASSGGPPVTTFTYTPLLTFDGAGGNPGPSYTVGCIIDGNRYALKGGFGNVKFTLNPGVAMMAEFEFRGVFTPHAAQALTTPTYKTTTPPAFLNAGASMNFGGVYTPRIREFSFDVGNEIVLGIDGNDSGGYYGSRIVRRNPQGSVQLEADPQATQDWYAIFTGATTGTITTGTVGASTGNQVKFDIARAMFRSVDLVDLEGIMGHDLPFTAASAANDTEASNPPFTLTFT